MDICIVGKYAEWLAAFSYFQYKTGNTGMQEWNKMEIMQRSYFVFLHEYRKEHHVSRET